MVADLETNRMADELKKRLEEAYKYGFTTDIESDQAPPGLNEDIVRLISSKKGEPEWMTAWRLQAYQKWLKLTEPRWAYLQFPAIDYNSIIY